MRRTILLAVLGFCCVCPPLQAQEEPERDRYREEEEFRQPEEPTLGECLDWERRRIRAEVDRDLPAVARAIESSVILINPEYGDRFFLSEVSLHWLFYRECAHIWSERDLREEISFLAHEEADCRAAGWLIERHEFTEYDLLTIQRDLERLDEWDWGALGIGPRRQPELVRCLKGR